MLCLIFFIFPLQIFIIGGNLGFGIQGSVYRFQMTEFGTYFFPITRELDFVLNGTYSGKTALSIILWVMGTALLACITIFSFSHTSDATTNYYRQIMKGLIVACGIYLGSCIAQYGFLFQGPAGISLPVGILVILAWTIIIWFNQDMIGRFLGA